MSALEQALDDAGETIADLREEIARLEDRLADEHRALLAHAGALAERIAERDAEHLARVNAETLLGVAYLECAGEFGTTPVVWKPGEWS